MCSIYITTILTWYLVVGILFTLIALIYNLYLHTLSFSKGRVDAPIPVFFKWLLLYPLLLLIIVVNLILYKALEN